MSTRDVTLGTLAAHAGRLPAERLGPTGGTPHIDPLVQTSVYDFATIGQSVPAMDGDGMVYARHGLPNEEQLGAAVARLEGGEAGLATNSGMSAAVALALGLCSQGDRLVVQRDSYGGTTALLKHDLARFGIGVAIVDAYDHEAVKAALAAGAKALLVESISNPLMKTVDLEGLAGLCKGAGAQLVVDNTFATPIACRPLERGADLVWHSVTKFIGGHHDLCAGAIVGSRELVGAVEPVARRMGLRAAPFEAWLAVRGVRSLEVRMRRAIANAADIGRRLRDHAAVKAVYEAADCALVSFDTGSRAAAEALVERCQLITLTPSLGGTTTTFSHPATSSHKALSEAERAESGITEGLLRLSLGLEPADDIWRDLERGLG